MLDCKGDGNALVCSLSFMCVCGQVCSRGEIIRVKVLGTLALIDEGETDWKVIVINVEDPEAEDFNGLTPFPSASVISMMLNLSEFCHSQISTTSANSSPDTWRPHLIGSGCIKCLMGSQKTNSPSMVNLRTG